MLGIIMAMDIKVTVLAIVFIYKMRLEGVIMFIVPPLKLAIVVNQNQGSGTE